jgi:hypothetical protein
MSMRMKRITLFRVCLGIALFSLLVMALSGCSGNDNPNNTNGNGSFNDKLRNLRLTEIHYHPRVEDGLLSDSLEFLEIKNVGSEVLSLPLLEFTEGISYTIPDGTEIDAGAFYVVAASSNAFESRYGFKPDGEYIGQLKNTGETVTLRDIEHDAVIFSQLYGTTEGWPEEADGDGYSLVTISFNPGRDEVAPDFWRRSSRLHGSPGKNDTLIAIDSSLFDLRITEIHYNPQPLGSTDGDSLEFIELKNTGTAKIDLGAVEFTNGISFRFPSDATIGAGKLLVLVSDITTFKKRYPDVEPAGMYTGKLDNGGERITITDSNSGVDITSVSYKDGSPWPSDADGDGCSLVPVKVNPALPQDNPDAWRRSFRLGGSPGSDDPGIVIINEVLTHTDTPLVDAVELYNPGDDDVNLKGWYLSDKRNDPFKYKIGDVTIPSGGYLFFDESDFNDASLEKPFSFSSHGEEAVLVADDRGCDSGYCHRVSFGELENGVSIGRYITSEGGEKFVPMSVLTMGKKNGTPLVGPVVISEIMYHSVDNACDYVELTNISSEEVRLYHPDSIAYTWKISGTGFEFPTGATIKPGESVIIASDSLSIDAFRTRYTIDGSVQVFQMIGKLSNGSEKLELKKPEDPYIADSTESMEMTIPYMIFDEVKYDDQNPWPTEADGAGMALHRKVPVMYGNDPACWEASAPNPGTYQND